MNDQFDHELQSLLSGSLRDRASRADAHGRGFGDVRRRVRRRRQRQVAVGLLPTAAAFGWFVTRPVASDPLRPADGASGSTDTSAPCEAVFGTTVPPELAGSPTTSTIAPTTVITTAVTVVEGDSWALLAERFGVGVDELVSLNSGGREVQPRLFPGMVIAVPVGSTVEVASGESSVTETTISWVSSSYVVQEGDTWNQIAERFGPDLQLLLAINGRAGEDPDTVLTRGDVIAIPANAGGGDVAPGESFVVECVTVSPTTVVDAGDTTTSSNVVPDTSVPAVESADVTETTSLQTTTTSIG